MVGGGWGHGDQLSISHQETWPPITPILPQWGGGGAKEEGGRVGPKKILKNWIKNS